MAFYECIFIARQDITSTQVETLTEQFSGILKENGGEVAAKEQWGLRTLAYKIKKNRKGHYVMLKIEAPSPALLEMERHMRLNEDVLRYMSVRVDELDPQPSAILQNKDRGGRDDRGARRGRFGDGGPGGGPGGGHSGGGRSGGGFSGNRKFDDKAPAQ